MTKKTTVQEGLQALFSVYGVQPWLERTQTLVALIDRDGVLQEWNGAFETVKNEAVTTNILDIIESKDRTGLLYLLQNLATIESARCNLLSASIGSVPYDCWLVPLPGGQALFCAQLGVSNPDFLSKQQRLSTQLKKTRAVLAETKRTLHSKDIELKAVLAQVDEIAHTDSQTYLPNRKYILARLQEEVHRVERYRTPLSISMLDIDHFKKVNDTYGHTIGDQVLLHLSDLLGESIRETDMVGRYGGEEFLIVLPNTALKAAVEQATRLIAQLRETPFYLGDHRISLTISIGVAQFQAGKENWHTFLSRADSALYKAKHEGRDRWAVSESVDL